VTNTAGGRVLPGGSIGTLSVGSYTQGSNSTLDVEVAPDNASRLHVAGAAALDGTLQLDFDPGSYGTRSYTVLDAASVTGRFSSVAMQGVGSTVAAGVLYGNQSVTVNVMPTSSGQFAANLQADSLQHALTLNDVALAHADSQYCERGQWSAPCAEVAFWASAVGGAGSQDSDGAVSGYNTRWAGMMAGIDLHPDDKLSLGLIASYSRDALNQADGGSRVQTDSIFAALTAGLQVYSVHLDAEAFWSGNDGNGRRAVGAAGPSATHAYSHPKSDVYGGALQVSQPVLRDLQVVGRLTYAGIHLDGFQETGAPGFNLAVATRDAGLLYGDLGLRYSHLFHLRSGTSVIPDVSIGVRNRFGPGSSSADISIADAQGTPFVVTSPGTGSAEFVGAVSVTAKRSDALAISFRAEGRSNGSRKEGVVGLQASVGF
jgi:outer membrane autotransporter protein